jgi:RNA-directed DNA polymerase
MNLEYFVKDWYDIAWRSCYTTVAQMQQDIVVAYKTGNLKKVAELQYTLVNSFSARAIAVRTVATVNKGKNTPGVDQIAGLTPEQKLKLVHDLKYHIKVKPLPVRRVWISKDGNPIKADKSNARPLGIPNMYDRAAQAFWALALNPIAECVGDRHSYGYRPARSAQDAMVALYLKLATKYRPEWILEADIKGFFDNITHKWIIENIPIEKRVLYGWLKAGYIDMQKSYESVAGVPQGGVISPIIANMVLDGLSDHVTKSIGPVKRGKSPHVLLVRYADDFVVTCASKELLEEVVKPTIDEFLKIRGLQLNPKKTHITHLKDGFDFLGFNFRIYPRKKHPNGYGLLIKPAKQNIQNLREKIKLVFKTEKKNSAYNLILKLSPILRGWGNYYCHVVSKQIFATIDWYVWNKCLKWAKSKHPTGGVRKLLKIYFRTYKQRKWAFFGQMKGAEIQLFLLATLPIKRHSLVQNLNPFDLENAAYFANRKHKSGLTQWDKRRYELLLRDKSICKVCNILLEPGQNVEIHHILPKKFGGSDHPSNLVVLHRECHRQVTFTKNSDLKARFVQQGVISKEPEEK